MMDCGGCDCSGCDCGDVDRAGCGCGGCGCECCEEDGIRSEGSLIVLSARVCDKDSHGRRFMTDLCVDPGPEC